MRRKRGALMLPLAEAMGRVAEPVTVTSTCGNLDTRDPCGICADPTRDTKLLCVVEEVADLWALERSGAFKGRYQVLGGTLSAIDGRGPDQLNMGRLVARATRSEEHTSELQSLMRISYAVFCLKKHKQRTNTPSAPHTH